MLETLAPTLDLESSTGPHDLGGLLGLAGNRELAFPLREVRVRASIAGNCCRTVVDQIFDNPYDEALEAVHIFPLPPSGAVTEMELRTGETVVRAECRERKAAERTFDEARAAGRRAALLTAERADVHTLRVTNIPPGAAVKVCIVVIQPLDESDGMFEWRFPTVVAPRYLPGTPVSQHGSGVVPDTDAVPDASRLQPPLRLAGGTKLDLEVEIAGPLASIASSLHAIRTSLGSSVRVAPSGRATLDRDFVLRFAPAAASTASVRAYTDGAFTLAVICPPAVDDGAARVPRDVVLVIDVSGSMSGEKLEAARRAMSAVLHGLEKGDRFRLIAFETAVHAHTAAFLPFDQPSLENADRWIRDLQPMGGTEMLPALKEAFAGTTPADRLRTVIFITDGQAMNEAELAATVERNRANAILFTVGIDTAVNESLLRRLAQIGHGTCGLLTPADDIEDAIVRLEARFGSPVLTGLAPAALEAARPQPVHLFSGRTATMLLHGSTPTLRFEGIDAAGGRVQLVADEATPVSFPLGALWAREHVAWLEDVLTLEPSRVAQIESEITTVALEHHIASRFTAFVAVEEHVSGDGNRITVVQPVELPAMWSHEFLTATAAPTLGLTMPFAYRAAAAFGPDEEMASDAEPAERATLRYAAEMMPPPSSAPAPRAPSAWTWRVRRPRRTGDEESSSRAIETALATSQDADGSFGGSVERTAAALVTLVRLRHTRQSGSRRRVVQKCARWLAQHANQRLARLALEVLLRVESGGDQPGRDEVADLLAVKPEGAYLARVLEAV